MKRGGSYMSPELREEISNDPEYTRCVFEDVDHPKGECDGRITREHAVIYAGKKIQEKWSIVPVCAKHHAVDQFQDAGTMVKEMNVWAALNRATDAELSTYDRTDYIAQRARLNNVYGVFQRYMPTA